MQKINYLEQFNKGLLSEKELKRLSPDDYEDLMYSEKAECEK